MSRNYTTEIFIEILNQYKWGTRFSEQDNKDEQK